MPTESPYTGRTRPAYDAERAQKYAEYLAEVEDLTRQLQAEGPDEFPEGYYRSVAIRRVLRRRRS